MEFVVCNKCGCPPSKRQFYITACSHVFCDSCRTLPTPDFCHLCKIPTKSLKMDQTLPKTVRKVFNDVAAMNDDIHKRLTKIIGFQKFQKSLQSKVESRKSTIRREQIARIEQKTQELAGQLTKLSAFEENNRIKLEETEEENAKLRNLIEQLEMDIGRSSPPIEDYDDDFFIKNTHTSSNPSISSLTDNDDDFDLLGLKNRSDSSSSNCSSQSNRPGSLF